MQRVIGVNADVCYEAYSIVDCEIANDEISEAGAQTGAVRRRPSHSPEMTPCWQQINGLLSTCAHVEQGCRPVDRESVAGRPKQFNCRAAIRRSPQVV